MYKSEISNINLYVKTMSNKCVPLIINNNA